MVKNNGGLGICTAMVFGICPSSTNALAGGYEKATLWSGQYSGIAGIGTNAKGPDALFFNPAGLAGASGLKLSLNGAVQSFSSSAPIVPVPTGTTTFAAANATSSDGATVSPLGMFASYGVTPDLTIGVGFYTTAGAQISYTNANFSLLGSNFSNLTPTLLGSITINEFSGGAAYDFGSFRLGAAYRLAFASANLTSAYITAQSSTVNVLSAYNMSGLNGTAGGVRLGAQFAPKDSNWGVGVQWRSETDFNMNGTSTGSSMLSTSTTATAITGGTVTAATLVPQQLSVGGYYDIISNLRVLAEYAFSQYAQNQSIVVTGNVTTVAGAGTIPNVGQNWSNMNNVKVGLEYKGSDWVIRGGYGYIAQVTPNSNASPLFSPPGTSNTLTLGLGKSFTSNLTLNLAAELTTEAGTIAPSQAVLPESAGVYTFNWKSLYLGLNYSL